VASVLYCSFDAEVAQFLLAGFKMLDIRDGHPPYLAVWDIMKVGILSLVVWSHLHETAVELGNGSATVGYTRGRRSTMATQNLELAASRWLTNLVVHQPRHANMQLHFAYRASQGFT
jgi:hypothetical protein